MKLKKLPILLCALFTAPMAAMADTEVIDETNNVEQLQTVQVQGKAFRAISEATRYQKDRVNLGLLGSQNAFTSPITVVNYDEKMVESEGARNLVDLIAQTDASTWQFGGETNTLNGLYVRGYQLDVRQFSVNGLAGLYSIQGSPTVMVGSAQLIKGASSALNGMDPEGAVSGAVNIETKKATDTPINKVGVGYFTDSRLQGSFDFGRRFGVDKQWGMRINGLWRHGDTPRAGYDEDNKELALSTDYRGDRLRLALDVMYAKRKATGSRARFQDIQNYAFQMPSAPDGRTNLVPSWQGQTTEDKTAMLTFEYDASDAVMLSGGIGYSKSHYWGNLAQLTAINSSGDYYVGTRNNRGSRRVDLTSETLSMNLTARGQFETGSVSHHWNAAYDRVLRKRLNYWGSGYTSSISTNMYAPDFRSGSTTLPALNTTPTADASYIADSLALSDTLGFADDQYRLTLGGRLQWIAQKNHKNDKRVSTHRFSPMAMLAWVPNPNWVIYGNYMEDLEPGSVDEDAGTMSDPRVSKQFEIGVRKNWGDVVTTLNVFQISRPGYWRGNSTSGTDFATRKALGLAAAGQAQGKERNRGVELNIYANLLDKTLRPSFGLMYLQSRLIDYPNYKDNLVNGVQVANPRVVAKAGIEWDTPFVRGLSVNAGVQYIGKSYQDTAKTYAFPSYTLVDIGAAYTMKLKGDKTLTVRTGVENLFNKAYWQVQRGQYDRSFAVLGMPRTFWLKADLAF